MTYTDYATQYARLLDLVTKAVQGMTCSCYFPDEMEYAHAACPKCQLERILESEPKDA